MEEKINMISFCCPSRGRPELAKRLVNTTTAKQKHNTEFLFYLNEDDEKLGLIQVGHISTEIPGMKKFVKKLEKELNLKINYIYKKYYE